MGTRWRSGLLAAGLLAVAAAGWWIHEARREPSPIPAPKTASLRVRVLAPGGKAPRAGAVVTLRAGSQTLHATSDATGRVTFAGPLRPGTAELEARAEGAGRTLRRLLLAARPNAHAIELLPEALLAGLVVDETGAPLANAAVEAAPATASEPDSRGEPLARTATDAEGAFKLKGLPAGRYAIGAHLTLHEDAVLPDVGAPSQSARIVLVRTSELRGRVVGADGAPVANAAVVAAGSGLWPPKKLATDADGRFELSPLPAGVYELRASSADAVSAPREGLLLDPASVLDVELPLLPGARLEGRVLDEATGQPLAGAEVEVIEDALTATPARVTTGADGRFGVAPLRAVRQRVWVRAPGYVPLVGATFIPGGAPARIALSRAGVLEGTVLDEAGAPVSGAELEVIGRSASGELLHVVGPALELGATSVPPPPTDNLAVTTGPIPKVPLLPIPVASSDDAVLALAGGLGFRSGEGGRFRIEGVPAGRLEITARFPGYAPSRSAPFELKSGQTLSELRVVLTRGVSLVGRVLDARGFAVEAVRVELVLEGEPLSRVTLSGRDGGFAFEAVRGLAMLTAYPTGAPLVQQKVDLRGSGRKEVTLQLGGEARSLQGRVVDARGFPIESAVVRVRALDPRSPEARATSVGRDGVFVVGGLPPPPYRIEAEHPSFAPSVLASVSPAAGTEVRIELRPGASVRGEVRDRLSGEPIAGAVIQLGRRGAGDPSQALSDAQGAFELRNLTADNYTVFVRHPPHVGTRAEVVLHGGEQRVLPRFELEPGGEISGDVVDRFGAPVTGAEVALGDPAQWSSASRSDASGHFQLAGIPPGEHLLWARHREAGELGTPIRVRVYPQQESPGTVLRLSGAVR